MKALRRRLHKLELRRIEQTPKVLISAKCLLLEKINAVRARLDAARERGEYVPEVHPEQASSNVGCPDRGAPEGSPVV